MIVYQVLAILLLAATHLFVRRLKLSQIPRSKWLSLAGGISVAYVFMQLIPELGNFHKAIGDEDVLESLFIFQKEVYLIALLGLTIFYGLERAAKFSEASDRGAGEEKENIHIFWLHIGSFLVYNFLIGYLVVHQEENTLKSLIFFTIAMSFHILVTDYGLSDHYKEVYRKKGRWLTVSALLFGWLTGELTEISEISLGLMFSFIAGGVIMNALKEELPKERESNFWAFLAGVLLYSIVLLSI